jgi:8-oxo-dGTP pyrophosphatase MutT (NUDIX family)
MGHIHNNPGEHDHTVSAFIIRADLIHPKLLLHRHKLLGKLMQPGGHVELLENPFQALCHEIIEETGYDLDQLEVLQPSPRIKFLPDAVLLPIPVAYSTHGFDLWPDHFHTDASYALVTGSLPRNDVAEGESKELRWFSLDELEEVDKDDIVENVWAIGMDILTMFLHEWKPVPLTEFGNKP